MSNKHDPLPDDWKQKLSNLEQMLYERKAIAIANTLKVQMEPVLKTLQSITPSSLNQPQVLAICQWLLGLVSYQHPCQIISNEMVDEWGGYDMPACVVEEIHRQAGEELIAQCNQVQELAHMLENHSRET